MSPAILPPWERGRTRGTITEPLITGKIRMASITDGTSNTLMVSECGPKPIGYNGIPPDLPIGGERPAGGWHYRTRQQCRRSVGPTPSLTPAWPAPRDVKMAFAEVSAW